MIATERDRSSRGLSLNMGLRMMFAVPRVSSGGGVRGRTDPVHIFLRGGSGLSLGLERFREIGEIGAMTALV
jgi:hypothetical protein